MLAEIENKMLPVFSLAQFEVPENCKTPERAPLAGKPKMIGILSQK